MVLARRRPSLSEYGLVIERIIDVDDVTKTFTVTRRRGRVRRAREVVRAVDGVSFSVSRGEMLGYVGPNGAGKSTTIKMLTGVLVPTSGRIDVGGCLPSRERVALARRIGVVFGQRSLLWWDLPLADSFELLRHLYRVPAADHRRRLADCVERLDLGSFLATPVRQLSLGQRIRGELTAALLHGPELLFLDEPTIGLDVVSKEQVRRFLAELNSRDGTTVLLTTHDLDDIERLCSRLLIIDHGHVIYDGGLDALRDKYGEERTLVVDLAETRPPVEVAHATVDKVDGPRQWLRFRRDATTAATLIADVAARYPLRDLTLEEPAIEDIVRRIYLEGM
jgi:viologen exporter family transport system ATP-binding protein